MKPDIHPEYREVVFQDTSSELRFITRSTIATSETVEFEGKEYPLAKVEISSESHPFYTGKQILVDSGGRVERFRRRYKKVGMETEGSGARAAAKKAASDTDSES
ncbi:MAG: type B 50S ribosomal protein L31 [Acidimicrobiia bacterium]